MPFCISLISGASVCSLPDLLSENGSLACVSLKTVLNFICGIRVCMIK